MDAAPEYRPMVAVDIEGSGGRGDVSLLRIREVLAAAFREALGESGIDAKACLIEDLGDGLRMVAPACVPKSRLIHPFFHELAVRLGAHNRTAAASTRIRLRVALHAGDVWLAPTRVAGGPLEVLARLLDARPAREALATAPATVPASLLVSQHFYDETVRHGYPGIDPESFRRVEVTEKEYAAGAWLHLPGLPAAAAQPPGGESERPAGSSKMVNKASGHGVVYATQNGDLTVHDRTPR